MRRRYKTREDFDCLKLQICKSSIDISVSYLFIYLNSTKLFKYPIFGLDVGN